MKNLMKLSMVLVIAALAFSSCNCFKKMAKNRAEIAMGATRIEDKGVLKIDVSGSSGNF